MRPTSATGLLISLVMFLIVPTANCTDVSFSRDDQIAVQAVLEHFYNGWLSGSADAVRSTFTTDAVLMPHHGVLPVVGITAINEFWWPATSVKTTITRFAQTTPRLCCELIHTEDNAFSRLQLGTGKYRAIDQPMT